MKKLLVLLCCLLMVAGVPACDSSDDDSGDGGNGSVSLTGTWSGSGSFTSMSDGSSANIPFSLELHLNQSGSSITGDHIIHPRPDQSVVRTGSVTGTANDGQCSMVLTTAWSLEGTYTSNAINIVLTEAFTGGAIAWVRGTATLYRQ